MVRSFRNHALIRFAALACMLLTLCACASRPERFEARARAAGLTRTAVQGAPFTHLVYRNGHALRGAPDEIMLVFIEGDGLPWVNGGTQPAGDPTPRRALALELLSQTPLPAFYLTRPCYNGLASEPGCNPTLWTSARYSEAVVESLRAALETYARAQDARRLLLIGYSGGGALAMLVAPRIENLAGLVTIAANLDTSQWTDMHDYLPLDASLNPALQPALAALQIHLVGERDANVPPVSLKRYLETHANAELWPYPFDHVCCWAEHWQLLLERVLERVSSASVASRER